MPGEWRSCRCTGTLWMPSGLLFSQWSMLSGFDRIEAPAATAWPIVLAFGLTLVFAGLVTAASVSLLGAVQTIAGEVGWFRDVLPVESHEWVPVAEAVSPILTTRQTVGRIARVPDFHRASLPLEIYPVSAGVKGGLAGSVMMALLATLYSILSGNGIWYAMNLLSASLAPAPRRPRKSA